MTHKERFESLGIQPPKGMYVNMEFKIMWYFIQPYMKICYIKIQVQNFENIWTTWKITRMQECIPVGCVPPARYPHPREQNHRQV